MAHNSQNYYNFFEHSKNGSRVPVEIDGSFISKRDAVGKATESLYTDWEVFTTDMVFLGVSRKIWIIAYYV